MTTATETQAPEAAAAPDPERSLVIAAVVREKGVSKLRLDCTGLHNYLDTIGVNRDAQRGWFTAYPQGEGGADQINHQTHRVQPKALLMFDPKITDPAKRAVRELDLAQFYGMPPTEKALNQLAESVKECVPQILQHYQPVEISVRVLGKFQKAPETKAPETKAPETK